MLKVAMSIFDPLGFLSPFTIRSRLLLQEVWRSGIGWGEKLKDDVFLKWKAWIRNLTRLSSCYVPRCYLRYRIPERPNELHVFCDASKFIYLFMTSVQ